MLIAHNIKLSRILKNTWQVDIIMIISCTATYYAREYLIKHHFELPTIIPTVLGTAIAFFIGFNNNQAYDRWWEARRVWGALVNDSRSWARCVISYISDEGMAPGALKIVQERMIHRHIAFTYALRAAMRNTANDGYQHYLHNDDAAQISNQSNIHNAILTLQSKELEQLSKDGNIDGFRFMEMNQLLIKFSDEMGMSERIKNTVFPTTYNYFTKVFIWLFVVSLTLVISQYTGLWSIFLGWMVGFVFVSTQVNGMSLVDPFENTATGIPLNQISRTIEINLLEMIGAAEIPERIKPINGEYIL